MHSCDVEQKYSFNTAGIAAIALALILVTSYERHSFNKFNHSSTIKEIYQSSDFFQNHYLLFDYYEKAYVLKNISQ